MSDPISRFERSLMLIRASWNVLCSDGELLVLPLLSCFAMIAIVGMFLGGAHLAGAQAILDEGPDSLGLSFYAILFIFYVVQYFAVIFFNTALVGAALERLEGGDPTVGSALSLACSRIGAILGYAVISATVGIFLRMVAERLGFIGRLIEAGAGLAWTVTTFLVVPVLAAEGIGPGAAIQRSASLLRKTWGENIIGNVGISFGLSIIIFAIVLMGIGTGVALNARGYPALAIPFFALTVAVVPVIALVGAALTGIYAAVVYRYAVTGDLPPGFDRRLVEASFSRKR